MHDKYHDNWPDRVKEAQGCRLGSVEGRTDIPERPRCRECQMVIDTDGERKLLLAVAEAAEKEHGAAFYHTDKENCAVCAALAALKGAKP